MQKNANFERRCERYVRITRRVPHMSSILGRGKRDHICHTRQWRQSLLKSSRSFSLPVRGSGPRSDDISKGIASNRPLSEKHWERWGANNPQYSVDHNEAFTYNIYNETGTWQSHWLTDLIISDFCPTRKRR